ncbi:hypothetical protein PMAN_a2025 [Pseudoalteromonas marina]|nr:hypothetical protein PMAN_a2025 [Pseudoalteromonas marina]
MLATYASIFVFAWYWYFIQCSGIISLIYNKNNENVIWPLF